MFFLRFLFIILCFFFFFNDTATTEIYTLSLHDALPIWSASRETRPVIGAPEAFLVTSLLEGVINSGTGASARALGVAGAVAGTTGTTNDGRDAWFVGYSSNLLALVWVGFDDGAPAGLSGAEGALPIWSEFM